jgi:LysR family transcriptional regulator, hydrogen peroxide-inducible genes activator
MAIRAGILRGLDLVAVPLEDDSPPRIIALAWRLSSSRKAMFRQLGEALRKALAERDEKSPPPAVTQTEKARSAKVA